MAETKSLATQSVQKNVAAIHIKAELTLTQRKMVNALLFNAYDNLRTADEHQIPVPLLCELVGIDAKNIANLKAALLSLAKTEITWNVLDGENSKSWNFATFLSGGSIEDGICTYRYDSGLAQQLYDPEIYARINLGVIKRIRTSHALVLYENCYRFIRIGATGWWDLATFRDLMGLSDTSYKAFKDLNKYVIKPAVKEINEVSNIVLELEYKRTGRAVSGVRFIIRNNPQLNFDTYIDEEELDQSPVFKRFLAIHDNRTLAAKMIQEYGEEQIAQNLEYVEEQLSLGKVRSKPAFLHASIQHNYTSADAEAKAKAEAIKQQAREMGQLADRLSERQKIERTIYSEYNGKIVDQAIAQFNAMSGSEQDKVCSEFLASEKFGQFEREQFRKEKWSSVLLRPKVAKFWLHLLPSPVSLQSVASEHDVDDIVLYEGETRRLDQELKNS